MIYVTSGSRYLDIDAYACCIAYAELLNLQEIDAQAASTAPLNESITPALRALPASLQTDPRPAPDDQFVLVDLSESAFFDTFVDHERIREVFDHHPGFEADWRAKLGEHSHIEFIGAAATLIWEQWQQAGQLAAMSTASAQLLAAGILDNTLNLKATITTERDRRAFASLSDHAALDKEWARQYFLDCERFILSDLATALTNDAKYAVYPGRTGELYVGQLAVWDARELLAARHETIVATLSAAQPGWFANIISISEGCSYFICQNDEVKAWLTAHYDVAFTADVARAPRLWLRKEIYKHAADTAQSATSES